MPPVVIAAGIGAAAGIGGAMLSSSAQKKAANKAASTATNTAKMNNALQEKIYNKNYTLLSPFVDRGNAAGDAINSLLLGTGNDAAFQNYLNSTGYQFQMDQGNKALQQGAAARGALQSGAAQKALQTYGQNTAKSFFKDYLGLLANQQGVGLSGASAVAGVGQNYANSVGANNNLAGGAAANAHLIAGNANANLYGNIAGGISGIANAFGSSYQPRSTPPIYAPEQASWYNWSGS